jgi:membrane-associated phospholipid phosphatase
MRKSPDIALRPPPRTRLANFLSYVINPLALPPVAFVLILWHFGASGAEIARVFAISAVFFTLLPLGYLVRMVRFGVADSIEVRRREHRARPFLVGVGFYLIGVVLLALVADTARPLLIALALLYPVNTGVVALITLRWKISVHMIGLAGFVSVLLFAALLVSDAMPPAEGSLLRATTVLPLLALIPVLMWARVRAGAHTLEEVVGGTVFGLIVPYAQLLLIVHLLGLV